MPTDRECRDTMRSGIVTTELGPFLPLARRIRVRPSMGRGA
ncbi:MAG TPA: hypothetical protein VJ506_00640 [Candidatus Limnocylindrales bacterium]|nr:hypothetical protein [Candidatus Limnocylindrales bacterium]